MRARIPVIATLFVLAAVAVMVALGVWQLDRMHEKEALLARYETSRSLSAEVPWPATESAAQGALYRRARLLCPRVTERSSMAGRNAQGEAGVAQYVECALPDGSVAKVVLGWSRNPLAVANWSGGEVRGILAPGPRLVADPPLGGLEANELPDPSTLPNNHFGYAVQWFLFAATALIVYGFALRRRSGG
jgi:surfeit locus 1 family protein